MLEIHIKKNIHKTIKAARGASRMVRVESHQGIATTAAGRRVVHVLKQK